MWEEKEADRWPIRLILNSKASNVLDFHTRHYSGRGLMKKMSGKELAETIGCGEEALQKTFSNYNDIADGKEKDPFGKKFFHNLPFEIDDTFYVALMEPVLHFTMGGIEINDKAQCLNSEGKPFDGLFVCGELAGGVHGSNRLGGSSLLGCVVYGRVAGESASKYLFQNVLNGGTSSASQRLGQISLHIDPNTPGKISVEWANSSSSSSEGGRSSGDPPKEHLQKSAAPVMKDDNSDPGKVTKPNPLKDFKVPDKEFTLEEVAKHNKKDDLWIAVKGVVMNVTDWVEEHPGGAVSFSRKISPCHTEIPLWNIKADDSVFISLPCTHTWAKTPRKNSPCSTTTKSSPSTPPRSSSAGCRAKRLRWNTRFERRSLQNFRFLVWI